MISESYIKEIWPDNTTDQDFINFYGNTLREMFHTGKQSENSEPLDIGAFLESCKADSGNYFFEELEEKLLLLAFAHQPFFLGKDSNNDVYLLKDSFLLEELRVISIVSEKYQKRFEIRISPILPKFMEIWFHSGTFKW